jgi:alcohol dehydrogenase class IV
MNPLEPPTISYLTDIWFAARIAASTQGVLDRLAVRRPLVVTDPGVRRAGLLDRLNLTPAAVFDAVDPNPSESNVLAALEAFRAHGCDGVLAVGGGSPIDCGKCVALLATHAPPLRQYALIEGGLPKVTANKPPLVAVPTTAGTGSEVGRGALVTFADGAKLAVISPRLIPQAAVCDPELTLGLPPVLTAATGVDAISHCVETFCSPRFNPVTDAIALDGLSRAWRHLRRAVADGSDLSARGEMLMAALEGGLTFQKGLGAVHALSHPLGGMPGKHLHHGTLNGVFLPHVLRFNADACPDKMDRMAAAIGLPGGGSALPQAFADLLPELGLPSRLSDMGVTRQDLDSITDAVLRDHSCATNPRPITRDDARQLLYAAY